MIEADAYHPPANVAKMRAGVPLTDGDRAGWLAAMAARLAGGKAREEAMVVTCSALKKAHRDRLRDGGDGAENSCRRAWTRAGVVSCPRDCWGASSTLEIPNPATERCLHVSITLTPEQICATVAAAVVASPETTQTPPPPPELRVVLPWSAEWEWLMPPCDLPVGADCFVHRTGRTDRTGQRLFGIVL